jgi:hypothetical protein
MGNPPVNPKYPKDPHYRGSELKPGMQPMKNGDYLLSPDGQYRLQLQNGQLVEYGPDGQKTWSKDVTEDDVGTEAGVSSSNTEDPNTALSINSDNELQNNQGDGAWITLGHTRYNHNWSSTDYSLQNDGNFVGKQSDGTVNDSTGYSDKTPYLNETIVAPVGASDQLASFISTMNKDIIDPLVKQFGSGEVKLKFTEETGVSNAPSWVGKDLGNTSAATGTGTAHDAWESAKNYVISHEQTWQKNDSDLTNRLNRLKAQRTTDVNGADGVIADCNQRLQSLGIPGAKAGSIKDESPAYSAINVAISGVQYYVGEYVDFSNKLAPANAMWPDGGTGPHDTKASGSGSDSTKKKDDGTKEGTTSSSPSAGTGSGTPSGGTGTDSTYTATSSSPTNYDSLFGNATDGAYSAGNFDSTGTGATDASYTTGSSYGSTYGAGASGSGVSALLGELQSDLANNGTASSDPSGLEQLMEMQALSKAFDPTGNGQNNNGNGNSVDNNQNSDSSQNSSSQNASAQSAPATAQQATAGPPAAVTAPATGNPNHLVSVSLDGETQQVPSVVADALNKELNNPNGSNAIDAYAGTLGDSTPGHPWQQLDDLSKLQTGDVVQWQDRSALVVHDDKGLHMIVDGQLMPLTDQTTQSPPQDSFGSYGDFKGFFHPTGADLNSSATPPSVETAVANPPGVTSTQQAVAPPPAITPPTTS